jgi:hypothetical protein
MCVGARFRQVSEKLVERVSHRRLVELGPLPGKIEYQHIWMREEAREESGLVTAKSQKWTATFPNCRGIIAGNHTEPAHKCRLDCSVHDPRCSQN